MEIELRQIPIRDLIKNYLNDEEEGVVGYSGKLNIRPKYQREYVYNDKQRNEVIYTVLKNFPLNIMYWVDNEDDTFEVLDGQQRTLSICEFCINSFSILIDDKPHYFQTLTNDVMEKLLNYELMVYFCKGEPKEKLDWFRTINIAGVQLTPQELRNAIYTGPWLSDAKRHFSKSSCVAYNLGSDYVKGSPIRQEILEKTLKWISNDDIDGYMSKHQKDDDANELWQYFQDIINWIKKLFPIYRKDMKSIDWGVLYNQYKDTKFNSNELERRYLELINDDEIEGKDTKGIYLYLITNDEKYLSLRAFTDKQKTIAFETQKGICIKCNNKFEFKEMEGDHILPWSKGGKTTQDNCQMLCKKCNGQKSNS